MPSKLGFGTLKKSLVKASSKFKSKGDVSMGTGASNTANAVNIASAAIEQPASLGEQIQISAMGAKHREETFGKLKEFWNGLLNVLRKPPISDLFRHLAKWIVFFFVLYVVFVGFKVHKKKASNPKYASAKEPSMFQKISMTFSDVGGGISKITSSLGSKASVGMPREKEPAGRCDDIHWVSMSGTLNNKKNVAVCFNSSVEKPAPIRWVINTENLYEYDMLPQTIKDKIQDNAKKLLITIPYIQKGASYVLSCKDAVYEDGTTAKDLFVEETNNYCKLKTQNLDTSYKYIPRYRPLQSSGNYSGIDVYQ